MTDVTLDDLLVEDAGGQRAAAPRQVTLDDLLAQDAQSAILESAPQARPAMPTLAAYGPDTTRGSAPEVQRALDVTQSRPGEIRFESEEIPRDEGMASVGLEVTGATTPVTPSVPQAASPRPATPREVSLTDLLAEEAPDQRVGPTRLRSAPTIGEQWRSGVETLTQGMASGRMAAAFRNLQLFDRIDRGYFPAIPEEDPEMYSQSGPTRRAQVRGQVEQDFGRDLAVLLESRTRQADLPRVPEVETLSRALKEWDFTTAWRIFSARPWDIMQQITVESAPSSIQPAAAGLALGPLGRIPAVVGIVGGSYAAEFGPRLTEKLFEALQERGVDIRNANAIRQALVAEPEIVRSAVDRAGLGAIGPALLDAITAGLTRGIRPGAGVLRNAGRVASDFGVEIGGEMAGEALGQQLQGDGFDLGEIALSGLGAVGQGVPMTATGTIIEVREGRRHEPQSMPAQTGDGYSAAPAAPRGVESPPAATPQMSAAPIDPPGEVSQPPDARLATSLDAPMAEAALRQVTRRASELDQAIAQERQVRDALLAKRRATNDPANGMRMIEATGDEELQQHGANLGQAMSDATGRLAKADKVRAAVNAELVRVNRESGRRAVDWDARRTEREAAIDRLTNLRATLESEPNRLGTAAFVARKPADSVVQTTMPAASFQTAGQRGMEGEQSTPTTAAAAPPRQPQGAPAASLRRSTLLDNGRTPANHETRRAAEAQRSIELARAAAAHQRAETNASAEAPVSVIAAQPLAEQSPLASSPAPPASPQPNVAEQLAGSLRGALTSGRTAVPLPSRVTTAHRPVEVVSLQVAPGIVAEIELTPEAQANKAEMLRIALETARSKLPAGIGINLATAVRYKGESGAGLYIHAMRMIWVALNVLDPRGRFRTADQIRNTVNHEIVHVLRALRLFRPNEWAALKNRAVGQWMAKYRIKERYGRMSFEDQIEEAIAEAFAEWAGGNRPGVTGPPLTLFRRIAEVLRAVWSAMTGRGWATPEQVFQRVESGELARRLAAQEALKGSSAISPQRHAPWHSSTDKSGPHPLVRLQAGENDADIAPRVAATLGGRELAPDATSRQLRDAAYDWYKRNLVDMARTVVNAATGKLIKFDRAGARQALQLPKALLRLVPAIPQMLVHGQFLRSLPSGATEIRAVHILRSAVEVAGRREDIVLRLHEMRDGTWRFGLQSSLKLANGTIGVRERPPPDRIASGENATFTTAPQGAVSISGDRTGDLNANSGAGASTPADRTVQVLTSGGKIELRFETEQGERSYRQAKALLDKVPQDKNGEQVWLDRARTVASNVASRPGPDPSTNVHLVDVVRSLQRWADFVDQRAAEAAMRGERFLQIDLLADHLEQGSAGLPARRGTGIKENRRFGLETEAAVGVPPRKESFVFPLATGTSTRIIPDILDWERGQMGEVKHTSKLYLSKQLRDYIAFAKQNHLELVLYVSRRTRCSRPLRMQIAMGRIRVVYFDGQPTLRAPPRC